MADGKPIKIRHTRPAFKSTTKPIVQSSHGADEDIHFVSEPTKEHPHRVVSMHHNTEDGRPVSEYFDPEGPVSEGITDPKPMLLPKGLRYSPLDDGELADDSADRLSGTDGAADSPAAEWSLPATHKKWERRFGYKERTLRGWRANGFRMKKAAGQGSMWKVHVEEPAYVEWESKRTSLSE